MSSVNVVYNLRSIKVPVTASTQLSEVRNVACEKEKLNSANYTLFRQGKQLDLTLPYRFANLVNNAQVQLVPISKGSQQANVRVKIRVPGGNDFIGSFSSTETVKAVLNTAELQGQLLLGSVEVDSDATLASLGGNGLMFTLKRPQVSSTNAASVTNAPQSKQVLSNTASQVSATQSTGFNNPRLTEVTVANSGVPVNTDVAEEEMDQSKFLTYYNHIKAQSETQMVSKSTKEKIRAEKLRTQTESVIIRVKFPDQSTLSGKFQPGETGAAVYQYVKSYLRNPTEEFTLDSMMPKFTLNVSDDLIAKLGSRALLVFSTKTSVKKNEPYLNDAAISMVKPTTAAEPESKAEPQAKEKEDVEDKPKSSKSLKNKLKPKWLKLHK